MYGDQVMAEFETVLSAAPEYLALAANIQTDDDDDEFVRICIAGFLRNATVTDWGRETYEFIIDARRGDFSEENLRDFFGDHWKAFCLFHCLYTGYNLGLLVSKKIDKDEFKAHELFVFPFRDARHEKIKAAFGH